MKIKVEAIVDTEDDVAFDGLAMEHSVGLLGTIVDWNVEYNVTETEVKKCRTSSEKS